MMEVYMPYIVSIMCAVISGLTSYLVARKQSKSDLQNIEKQFALDIEIELEKFAMEKEQMELEHKHQLELKQKEMENQLGSDLFATFAKEYIRSPVVQAQMRNAGGKKR